MKLRHDLATHNPATEQEREEQHDQEDNEHVYPCGLDRVSRVVISDPEVDGLVRSERQKNTKCNQEKEHKYRTKF